MSRPFGHPNKITILCDIVKKFNVILYIAFVRNNTGYSIKRLKQLRLESFGYASKHAYSLLILLLLERKLGFHLT